MGSVITVFIILVCILLILVVLIQNSKGGGLSSQFAGSNQIMGVRRTADFLEKATYTLAIVLLVLSLLSSANINKSGTASEGPAAASSEVKQKSQETPLNNIPSGMPTKLNQQKPLTPPATEPNPKKP
jgi:preprotein translocase subunit SecG